jgi:hypothetical protein
VSFFTSATALILSDTLGEFSAERPNQRRSSLSRLNQEVGKDSSQQDVVSRRGGITVACRTCRAPIKRFEARSICARCEAKSQNEVVPQQSKIPVACGRCRKSKSRCSGVLPTCEPCKQCQELGLECVSKAKLADGPAEEKLQETVPKSKLEELANMMDDLELETWHFVSHEEAEDYELLENEST